MSQHFGAETKNPSFAEAIIIYKACVSNCAVMNSYTVCRRFSCSYLQQLTHEVIIRAVLACREYYTALAGS
jgi:hypothetical protein